jgi:N-acyl-D-aspartate/D-glutamate deacylase
VGAFIGHTPLRLYAMGDEAVERPATDDEIETMRRMVLEAMDAGALGFATSRSPTHVGAGGRPVPSRFAEVDEVFRIADALREAGKGLVQVTPGPGLFLEEFATLSTRLGLPVTWTALLTGFGERGTATGLAERTASLEGEVWPQVACRPLVMQVNLEDPFPIAMLPSVKEVLAVPRAERAAVYADPEWRERARPEVSKAWAKRWAKMSIEETGCHHALVGRTVAELAEERGVEPFDVLVDLSLEDGLRTRFRVVLLNDDEVEVADLLRDKRTILGLSDAGAHASQLCDACFSTHLLGYWSRQRQTLSLEEAVWRLTGHPAQVFRLEGRGLVREGFTADLVAFDPERVGTTAARRTWDLPAGADRLVVDSEGVEHVWVGGVATRSEGVDVEGVTPGRLLRK